MRDAAVTLRDGRTLAYTDLGDSRGPVVMYFHGAPTSRLDLVGFEEPIVERGIRVVSPDRPGYGGSSPQPNRTMRDWPMDVAALANHLDVEQFAVVGLSAGGPYAVACGALLPEQVVGVGVANGVTDMSWPPAWDGYDPVDASIMRLGDEDAARRWMEAHYGPDGSRFFTFTTLAPSDAALLEDQARAQTLLATIVESFRQGVGGLAADLTIQGRPWPFDPSTVQAPTIVLHGENDPYLPVAHGHHTADVIPNARFVLLRGEGHVSLIREVPQLCTDVLARREGDSVMTIIDLSRTDTSRASDQLDLDLDRVVVSALTRWPTAGVSVAVVRDGAVEFFSHGVADVATKRPVTEDTVFRVGSLTKTITAVAVMQLYEAGLVDLDAPANDYLHSFKLVPAKPNFGPATVRHLLTHTAGAGFWRRLSDVFHPGIGSGVSAPTIDPLAEYYRGGLRIDVEPGTRWAYSNHGFAALGQIVEDVSGEPLDRYFRKHVFEPLGMEHTSLAVSDELRRELATGYTLKSRGLAPVAPHEVPTPGGGGLYSTATDMARYVSALLGGGANEHGRVLAAETVATMFRPHFQPDSRVAGMGLGFELREESGRRLVGKGGTMLGFLSAIELSPDDRLGVIVLTNTGGLDNRGAAEPLAAAIVRRVLGLPDDPVRDDIAPHPEAWGELCGWYAPDAGPVTNLFLRVMMGAGVEVVVRRGQLVMKPLTPIPAMRSGMVLHRDDPDDPRVFRVVMPDYGRTDRVVFTDDMPRRLLLDVMSFEKRPDALNPRRWVASIAATGAVAVAVGRLRRRRATPD